MKKKLKNISGFIKDTESKAIINVDTSSLIAYKKRREYHRTLETQVEQINILKNEVSEIKTMLIQVLDKK
jgi:hypothetical protein